jgi:hypothetical protein
MRRSTNLVAQAGLGFLAAIVTFGFLGGLARFFTPFAFPLYLFDEILLGLGGYMATSRGLRYVTYIAALPVGYIVLYLSYLYLTCIFVSCFIVSPGP